MVAEAGTDMIHASTARFAASIALAAIYAKEMFGAQDGHGR
jgi:hypothetical protein